MKLLKILIGTIITLILLFIAAVVVLVNLVDPNDFKSKITEVVHQETGRDLEIGNISWSFFPWVGIKVNDVSFSNGADFKGQNFVKVGEAGLHVEFLPIFKGQVRVGALTLKNADIKLMKNKAGKTNWQDLTASEYSPQKATPVKSDSSGATGSKIAFISISSINISNSNVSWNDAQAGQKIDIQDFNLHCKGMEIDPKAKELSNKLKLQGDVNIGQVTADKVRISDIKTHIRFEKGVLVLKPLRASFYGGKFDSSVTVNLKNKIPSIILEESLTNLQLEPLLKDLANTNNLNGTADIDVAVTTAGIDPGAMLKNLNGKASVKIANGTLKGVDIEAIIAKAESLLNKVTSSSRDTGKTAFDSLTGTFVIRNGVVTNNDLLLKATKFQLSGQGTINLVTTGVKYQVKATKVSGDKVEQVLVPINIAGTFDNLSYKPDFSNFLGSSVKNVIKNATTAKPVMDLGRSIGNLLH